MNSLDPEQFLDGLLALGYDFFCSVPCSYFAPLLSELSQRTELLYQVASVEAEAIASAAGAALAGRKPLVMLQNSGLGNCVNPVSSLLSPFGIPLVMLVSHRGIDVADRKAPQHDMMGAITYDLLELLCVPAQRMPSEFEPAIRLFDESLKRSQSEGRPYAIVLEEKPFRAHRSEPEFYPQRPTRQEAMQALQKGLAPAALVVASTGMVSRDLQTSGDRSENFYMVGSMGLASSIALGLASSLPERTVVVVDGDGSCLMRLGSLPTIGRYRPGNLLHVVLDNATHSSTGGQPTAASNVDFPALARAAGYRSATELHDLDELTRALREFTPGQGPRLVRFRIRSGNDPDPKRVERSLPEVKSDFMRACRPS